MRCLCASERQARVQLAFLDLELGVEGIELAQREQRRARGLQVARRELLAVRSASSRLAPHVLAREVDLELALLDLELRLEGVERRAGCDQRDLRASCS